MLSDQFNSLFTDKFVSDYLQTHRVIVMPMVNRSLNMLITINLQQLPQSPVNFAEILIRWIIFVNKPRIEAGKEILITYDIIKKCPIWKIIKMPIKTLKATRTALNKPVGPVPARKMASIGSINKKSR